MADVMETTHVPAVDTGPGRPRPKFLVPALVAALVVAVTVAATFVVLWRQSAEVTPAEVAAVLSAQRDDVERVSAEVIGLLTNYDATNIDQVAERMLEVSTGNFRKDYEATFASGLGGALEEVEASTRGEILSGPDVSFRSASEAVAVARVSEIVQNKQIPAGRTFEYLIEITLIDTVDGGWKADRVEILSGRET